MEGEEHQPKKKHLVSRIILWIIAAFLVIVAIILYYLYSNFNKLLSEALLNNFNSTIISDVYELKFEKLNVNVLLGNIQVLNVDLKPRQKPLRNYPYINSSVQFHARKLLLTKVEIYGLIKSNILKLGSIEFIEPDIVLKIGGEKRKMFPYKDTSNAVVGASQTQKKPLESFVLRDFSLVNANLHITNSFRQRESEVKHLNISVKNLLFDQKPGRDELTNGQVDLSIGEISWRWQKGALQYVTVQDYKIKLDSLFIRDTPDTTVFHFAEFSTGLKALDLQTGDSLFHLTLQSFNLSYKDQSITLKGISFKPNISDAAMQRRFTYQTPVFAGSVGTLNLVGLNFDSLIYVNKIFVEEINLDKVSVTIFKDQRKPVDKTHFPKYPGQQIGGIGLPLSIKHVKATNVDLVNTEKKPDGSIGRVNINRMTLDAKNITSFPSDEMLSANADAFIENKAHAYLSLQFNYKEPRFMINGTVSKTNLPDLNVFLKSYTPASIIKGTADEIKFSANAYRTYTTGTMKFLYHDLEIDLALKEQAKWKSDFLAFAANTFLATANPVSENKPERIVQFHADRDMNKGFINIIIKSVLAGLKETIIMSKENRKAYKEAKKNFKKKNK